MSSYNYEKALSIEWNGQMFVLTVRKETSMNADYLYSYDGTNWKTVLDLSNSSLINHKNPYNVKWTGTQYSMVGDLTTSEGGGSTLLKSKDGQYFSHMSTNLNTPLYDLEANLEFPHTIVFPKNMTLALGGSPSDSTKIAYSLDEGMTWTPSANSQTVFTNTAQSAYWNGKIWVAVGSGTNTIATSTDGIYWIGRGSYIFTEAGHSVFWNKEKSIWLASGKGTNSIAYSYDGVYWTGLGNTLLSEVHDIKCNGKIWVATGVPGTKSIAYSYDGIYWTTPSQTDLFDIQGLKINWNGYFWTVLGNSTTTNQSYNIATSPDGIVWIMKNNTFLTNLNTTNTNIFSNVNNTLILNGTRSVSLTTTHNYSQLLTTPITDLSYTQAVIYNGTYYLLGGNAILYSTDAVHWSSSPIPISNMSSIRNFAWNHPYLGTPQIKPLSIALGEGNNTMAYSEDGIYWKGLGNSIFTERGNRAIWNGTLWVAVGKGLFWVATSYNGTHWLGRENTLMTECYDVAWNGTVFIAVGYGAHHMAVSSDGIHWYGIPNANTLFSIKASAIVWTGKRWIAYGSGNNTTAYSDSLDGWIWNPTPKPNQVITHATSIFENTQYIHPPNRFSASSYSNTFLASNAFDNTMDMYGSTSWCSANNTYNTTTGLQTQNTTTTYTTLQDETLSVSGEWLQIKMENLSTIKYYSISCYVDVSSSYYTLPKEWVLLGSTDGQLWNQIDEFHYTVGSPPRSLNEHFWIKIQNIYTNPRPFKYYRFVFPSIFAGGSLSFVKISEIDLFCENENTTLLNERLKPIVTKRHMLLQNNMVSFSKTKKTIYQIADLYGTPLDTLYSQGIHYNPILVSDSLEETTGFCFDGENLISTQKNGHIKYINNPSLNTVSVFDPSSANITQNIPANIYASCFNGQRIIVGGSTGNILSYSSPFYKYSLFYNTIHTDSMFSTVYGLASNPGYGFLCTPNRIYFSPGEKVSVIGPKAYNKNISNSNQISVSLYNAEIIQNITLPSTTIIFGLLGPTGPRGAGDKGPMGEMGLEGPQGPTGYYGVCPYGQTGENGMKGITGNTGEPGQTGFAGEQGVMGTTGNTGCAGPTGSKGQIGYEGPTGPIGVQLWTIKPNAQIHTHSSIGLGKESVDPPYILDISGELYQKGNSHIRHTTIRSYGKIQQQVNIGNALGNHTVDISGHVLTNQFSIHKENTDTLSLDVSGQIHIQQLYVNQLHKPIYFTSIVNDTHIRMDYTKGNSFYLNIGHSIQNDFYGIVENIPITRFSHTTFSINLIIDYKDAFLNERYYCNQLIIQNQSYPVFFNDGNPSSPTFYTNSYFIQQFTILCSNSTILKVICNVKNY